MLTGNSSDNPYPTTTLLFVLRNMTGLGVARHDTELAVKSITVAVLSKKGKVGVWHSTAQNWQVIRSRRLYSVGQQIRGVACNGTELARNTLTVAVLSRRGNVVVWHAMAQIWQVILSRWLYSVGEARSGCFMS